MKFVLRHLNIFTRPCSIDGKEWEEKHDPEVMIDIKVGLSCLLFLSVSAIMYYLGDIFGSLFFVVVTVFSTLSDAVFVNHYYLDFTDRITAAGAVCYMIYSTTGWFVTHRDWSQAIVWIKLMSQICTALIPFKFLDQCRQHPVRSEDWRDYHVMWHLTGTAVMIFSILVSEGYFDESIGMLISTDLIQNLISCSTFDNFLLMSEE